MGKRLGGFVGFGLVMIPSRSISPRSRDSSGCGFLSCHRRKKGEILKRGGDC